MTKKKDALTVGGGVPLFGKGKFAWKVLAAGAVMAVLVLGGFAIANRLGKQNGSMDAAVPHVPAAPVVKPNQGVIIFQSHVEGLWQIFSLNLSSGVRMRLTRSSADDIHPSVSPDGAWIAFESTRTGTAAVWRMRADGTEVERLSDDKYMCLDPCWGGGGSFLLYSSRRGSRQNIFKMDLATRREQQLTDSFWRTILPTISADGSAIAFSRNQLGWDVYRMNPDGSGAVALTSDGGNCRPDWSPDGKRIAFVSDVGDGKGDIWTMDADGGNKVRVTPGDDSFDYNPAWSPCGRWLVYETTKGSKNNPWSLAVIPASGGTPYLLTPSGANDRFPDWTPGKDDR